MADFEVIFVDVGEGDATFIKLPDGKYALVDVFRCEDHGTVDLHRLLDARLPDGATGKKRLDYLIITHAHDDHIRGLGELYDRYEVGELWLPQHGYKEAPGDEYAEFERVEKEHPDDDTYWPKGSRTPWRYLGENDEVTVRCFSPPGYITVEEELDEDEARRLVHENCMVLTFEYEGYSVMLTGDSNLPAWKRIHGYYEGRTDENDLDVLEADVLHASHHGSRTFVKDDKDDKPWLGALGGHRPRLRRRVRRREEPPRAPPRRHDEGLPRAGPRRGQRHGDPACEDHRVRGRGQWQRAGALRRRRRVRVRLRLGGRRQRR